MPGAFISRSVTRCRRYKRILKFEDIVNRLNRMAGFCFGIVKYSDVFLPPVEVQPTQRLTIVVIHEHAAIALGITHGELITLNWRAYIPISVALLIRIFHTMAFRPASPLRYIILNRKR